MLGTGPSMRLPRQIVATNALKEVTPTGQTLKSKYYYFLGGKYTVAIYRHFTLEGSRLFIMMEKNNKLGK